MIACGHDGAAPAGVSRPAQLKEPRRARTVSVRVRPDLLERAEAQAAQHDVPWEAVLATAIEYGLGEMEKLPPTVRRVKETGREG